MRSKKWFSPKQKENQDATTKDSLLPEGERSVKIKKDIKETEKQFSLLFGNSSDFLSKKIQIGEEDGIIYYLSSMTDSKLVADAILIPITTTSSNSDFKIENQLGFEEFCQRTFVGVDYSIPEYEHEIAWYILSGYVVLILERLSTSVAIKIVNTEHRPISEPGAQTIIRGPKDGFTEAIATNISLIRRRIKLPALRFEPYIIGNDTKTSVSLVFIEGVINQGMLDEIRKRLKAIKVSGVFDSGNVEELIADKTFTPFPLVLSSERPDAVAADLTTGKIAIIVDGSPFVLILPVTFHDFFQISEDYFQPFMMSTFLRWIRYLSFLIALLLPALYVAITTYHHEMLPTQLLISIMSQREGIPFPAIVEVLLMEISFEILREAGIRMPRVVGQTISIVGGLVIGQAAVEAGIVSNIMVIIVALTAMASYVSPIYSLSIATRLLRFVFIVFAAMLGLYGILLGMLVMFAHMVSLRSFGVPYMAPLAPMIMEDQDDTLFRLPIWFTKRRPSYLQSPAPVKNPNIKKPSPPSIGEGEQS